MAVRPNVCFSCDRPTGRARECPYCGESVPRASPPDRLLAVGLLFGIGVAMLIRAALLAQASPTSTAALAQLPPGTMVELSGVVADTPYVRPDGPHGNYLSFALRDQTGRARIVVEGKLASTYCKNRTPCARDLVTVRGSLDRQGGKLPRVRIHARDGLWVQTTGVRAEALTMRR